MIKNQQQHPSITMIVHNNRGYQHDLQEILHNKHQDNKAIRKKKVCFDMAKTSYIPRKYNKKIENHVHKNLQWYSRNDLALFRSYANATITLARKWQQKQQKEVEDIKSTKTTLQSIFHSTSNPSVAYCTLGLEHFICQQTYLVRLERQQIVKSIVFATQKQEKLKQNRTHHYLDVSECLPRSYHTISLLCKTDAQKRALVCVHADDAIFEDKGSSSRRTRRISNEKKTATMANNRPTMTQATTKEEVYPGTNSTARTHTMIHCRSYYPLANIKFPPTA